MLPDDLLTTILFFGVGPIAGSIGVYSFFLIFFRKYYGKRSLSEASQEISAMNLNPSRIFFIYLAGLKDSMQNENTPTSRHNAVASWLGITFFLGTIGQGVFIDTRPKLGTTLLITSGVAWIVLLSISFTNHLNRRVLWGILKIFFIGFGVLLLIAMISELL